MVHHDAMDSEYCSKCGNPLLFSNKPCPKCSSVNIVNNQKSSNSIPKNYFSVGELVYPKEKIYFAISLTYSILFYLLIIVSIVGIAYLISLMIFGLFMQGLFIGYIRGNAIKVTSKQFAEVHEIAQEYSLKLGFDRLPDIYVVQSGGMLNALATRFFGKNFVILYSDVLELAYKQGQDALEFIICHELTHLKRNHITKHIWLLPAVYFPFLGAAYSRACEYTCDRFGAYLNPEGAIAGLLVLAAGKELYTNVNVQEYITQSRSENGFWSWFAEITASHPHLYKRLSEVQLFTNKSS